MPLYAYVTVCFSIHSQVKGYLHCLNFGNSVGAAQDIQFIWGNMNMVVRLYDLLVFNLVNSRLS